MQYPVSYTHLDVYKRQIYMNPNIGEEYIDEIMKKFGLISVSKIIYDNSSHYKSHLDKGWRADTHG